MLWVAVAAIGLLPVVNALTTTRNLFASLRNGDGVYVALELTLLVLAGLHAVVAVRAAQHRTPVRVAKPRKSIEGAAA